MYWQPITHALKIANNDFVPAQILRKLDHVNLSIGENGPTPNRRKSSPHLGTTIIKFYRDTADSKT